MNFYEIILQMLLLLCMWKHTESLSPRRQLDQQENRRRSGQQESRAPSRRRVTPGLLIRQEVPWNGRFYSYRFLTTSGIWRREQARLKDSDSGGGGQFLEVEGEYAYRTPDGAVRSVDYRADERGYRASESLITSTRRTPVRTSTVQSANTISSVEFTQRASLTNVYDINNVDENRVIFPDEYDDYRRGSTEGSVATTTAAPESTTDFTFDDYEYNEIGNRIGSGVPPAVLASLLGG